MRDVENIETFTYSWDEDGLYITIETDGEAPYTMRCNDPDAQAKIIELGYELSKYRNEQLAAQVYYRTASDSERAAILGADFHDGLPLDDPKSEGYAERMADNLALIIYGFGVVSLAWSPAWPYGAFYGFLGTFLLLVGLRQGAKARRRIEKERTAARKKRQEYRYWSAQFDYWVEVANRRLGK